jgi:1,4-dihydroxy-2-naphthoate octaprenyltransferase
VSGLRALAESFLYCRVSGDLRALPRPLRVLAASRLCVLSMTAYGVALGGLMAWLDGSFSWPLFLALLAGFTAAHLADNLLNDLTDVGKGIDEPGYFRTLYGPHPIIDGIVSPGEVRVAVASILLLDMGLAVYLAIARSWLVLALALIGALIMASYSGFPVDAKKLGLGELLVAIVWGPIIAGGTYLALTGHYGLRQALVYTPYAAAVSLVLVGKHLDKYSHDKSKGVRTLPVRLGAEKARRLAAGLALASTLGLPLGIAVYTKSPWGLTGLLALPGALGAARILYKEKPGRPPSWWPVWPLWYAAWGYSVLDLLGRYGVASLLLSGLHGAWLYLVLAITVLMAAGDLRRTAYAWNT